ncbi:MAG: RDD family protein [Candidatus Omnitrophica bacterium]|nr:RDD family protein [Candidatus Omnitrophota bacterium]MCM8809733.1 RDD family protein [Candidatus Omnitrophota bacterium]MCM8810613.1 RDD family protein [Candidatus Omnitrophota bacterium]
MENQEIIGNNQNIVKELKYANLFFRLLALIIDIFIFWCIYSITFRIFFPFANPDYFENLINNFYSGKIDFSDAFVIIIKTFIFLVIFFLIFSLYKILVVGKFGASLGKMIVGIKILDENGNRISFRTAFIREVVVKQIIYPIFFFISFLGYLWAIWDKRKQTWHDKIARTIVIKE